MQLLQTAFVVLLVGVLAASVISVAIMALLQIGRTRRLARQAESLGLRFASEDPFDAPRRYADFALITNGHSPRASNVTYGRLDGRMVRAFDFRYEVGHGTRRVTRHYDVVVVESERDLGNVLMWHDSDDEFAPLAVRGEQRAGAWGVWGDVALVERLAEAIAPRGGSPVSMQCCGGTLMLFAPERRRRGGYAARLEDAVAVMDVLDCLPPHDGTPAQATDDGAFPPAER